MSIYKPSLLDKFKDFVNGLKGNWDQYEAHVADFEAHLAESVSQVGGVHGLEVEKGEWNPVVYAGSTEAVNAEYSANGNYYRIGNYVNCQFYLNITDRKSYVGALNIRGLPFVVKNATSTVIGSIQNIVFETDWININVSPLTGTSAAYIYVIRSNRTLLNFPIENLEAGNRVFSGEFSYYI